MPATTARVLVLGLGNDILTDDAVGLHVARAVSRRLEGERDIEVKATTEMGLALLDEIAGRSAVVLVDSVQSGNAPAGFIHEIDATALACLNSRAPHMLGIGETLALGRILGLDMPCEVRAFAVEAADSFSLGTDLTAAVRDAVPAAAGRVARAARLLARALGPTADGRNPAPAPVCR